MCWGSEASPAWQTHLFSFQYLRDDDVVVFIESVDDNAAGVVVPRRPCDVQLSVRRGCWLNIVACGGAHLQARHFRPSNTNHDCVTKVSAIYDVSREEMHARSVCDIFFPGSCLLYFWVWEGNCKTPLRKAHNCSLTVRYEHMPAAEFTVCELPVLQLMTCWLNNEILRYHGRFTSHKRQQHGEKSLRVSIYDTKRDKNPLSTSDEWRAFLLRAAQTPVFILQLKLHFVKLYFYTRNTQISENKRCVFHVRYSAYVNNKANKTTVKEDEKTGRRRSSASACGSCGCTLIGFDWQRPNNCPAVIIWETTDMKLWCETTETGNSLFKRLKTTF